jgi:hypothetical protein
MAYPKRATIDPVRTAGFAAIGGAYTALGSSIASPCRAFSLINLTDATIAFSDDGVNDKFILPSGNTRIVFLTLNKTLQENYFLAEGTQFWVRDIGVAATLGSVYLEVLR